MRTKHHLTAEERIAMQNLTDYAVRSFQSKRTLKIMQRLYERGLIDFDVFRAKATATPAGIAAVKSNDPPTG